MIILLLCRRRPERFLTVVLLTTPAVSIPLAIPVLIPAQQALRLLLVLPDTVPKP